MEKYTINGNYKILLCFIALICTHTISAQITSYPYLEDFENGPAGWTVDGTTTSWELGIPSGNQINSAASGENAWVTNLTDNYLNNENGWVQSPVFDLSSLVTPYIQFNIRKVFASGDGAVLQASSDLGASWQNIGLTYDDFNWYDSSNLSGMPGEQPVGWTYSELGWLTAIHDINDFLGATSVIFRIAFGSDNTIINEGFAFDNIQISDSYCYAGNDFEFSDCMENGSTVNLSNELDNAGRGVEVLIRRWRFISGPIGPRGPWVISVVDDDEDVVFPNTGSGPDEYYVFEYTVEYGECYDSAIVSFCMQGENAPSYESEVIFICSGELIESPDELFNVFDLSQIRYLDDINWSTSTDFVSFPIGAGEYSNHDSTFEEFDTETNEYYSSGNRIVAKVQEIDCSDEGIELSFANVQNTNDGIDSFYELDVMIKSTEPGNSFKLGDGKLVFRYNQAAFGNYVNAYKNIEITSPDGYIAGQTLDSDTSLNIYNNFTSLDNRNDTDTSRFSWGFKQRYSTTTFAADNVTNSSAKLCHIKIKYQDANLNPMLLFESDGIYDNKFTTATVAGLVNGGSEIEDGSAEPRTLITNDTFNSQVATLSNNDFDLEDEVSLYPNPTKDIIYIKGNKALLKTIKIYSITGSEIMELNKNLDEIDISQLQSGVYFLKLISENATKTVKVIKN